MGGAGGGGRELLQFVKALPRVFFARRAEGARRYDSA